MLTENKKTVLIITLAVSALLVDLLMLLGFILINDDKFSSFNKLLYETRFFRWGWLPVIGFAGYALKKMRGWTAVAKGIKISVIIVLLIALAMAAIWIWGVLIISTLKF